jgi:hypothetical protein
MALAVERYRSVAAVRARQSLPWRRSFIRIAHQPDRCRVF